MELFIYYHTIEDLIFTLFRTIDILKNPIELPLIS